MINNRSALHWEVSLHPSAGAGRKKLIDLEWRRGEIEAGVKVLFENTGNEMKSNGKLRLKGQVLGLNILL